MNEDLNTALSHRWFEEVWNQRHEQAIDELAAPDIITHGLGPDAEPGTGPFRAFWRQFCGAFPDIHVTVEDVIAQRDMTCTRISFRGTHRGDHLGVPATNNAIAATGLCLVRWRDGRIVEAWNEFDVLGLMTQAGAVQAIRS